MGTRAGENVFCLKGTSTKFLAHFDSTLKLTPACDASAYGVLADKMPDGSDKPIRYASRTLTKSERGYSQLEKEGLTCVFGIEFHNYLFGGAFKLVTYHRPLLGLLKPLLHKPHPGLNGHCSCQGMSSEISQVIPMQTL